MAQVKADYGDQLRFLASEEQRRVAIFDLNDASMQMSDQQYTILSLIAKCRSVGISQVDLGRALNTDPRSIFHFIKALGQRKLLIKIPLISKGVNTHLCLHKRFAHENKAYLEYIGQSSSTLKTESSTEELLDDVKTMRDLEPKSITFESSSQMDLQVFKQQGGLTMHQDLLREKITSVLSKYEDQVVPTEDLIQLFHANDSKYNRRCFNRSLQFLSQGSFIQIVHVPRKTKKGADLRCARFLKQYTVSKQGFTGFEKNSSTHQYLNKMKSIDRDSGLIIGEGGVLFDVPLEWQVFRLICLSGDSGITTPLMRNSLNNLGTKILGRLLDKLMKCGGPSKGLSISRTQECIGRERRYRYFASKKAVASIDRVVADEPKVPVSRSSASQLSLSSVMTSSTSPKTSPKNRSLDLSKMQRRNIILDLLEEHKIIEGIQYLSNLYDERIKQQGGTEANFKVDRKTLNRTVESLEQDSLVGVHWVQVPQLTGSYTTRMLIVHKSLREDNISVKHYIRQMQERTFICHAKGPKGPKRFIEEDAIIERIPLAKKQKDADGGVEPVTVFRGNEEATEESTAKQSSQTGDETLSLEITSKSLPNFVTARMMRCRLIYDWLFKMMLDDQNENVKLGDGECPFKNEGIVKTTDLFGDMPLELYMKVVGLSSKFDDIKDFLQNPANLKLTVSQLPPKIRNILAARSAYQKTAITQAFEVFEFLNLVKPIMKDFEGSFASSSSQSFTMTLALHYQLLWNVALFDPASSSRATVKEYHLSKMDRVQDYWSQLEHLSIRKLVSDEDVQRLSENPLQSRWLQTSRMILFSRSWYSQTTLTESHKEIFRAFINQKNETTPLRNEEVLLKLSRETGLSLVRIKHFFKKVEETFYRKRFIAKQKTKESLLRQATREAASLKGHWRQRNLASDASLDKSQADVIQRVRSKVKEISKAEIKHRRRTIFDPEESQRDQRDTVVTVIDNEDELRKGPENSLAVKRSFWTHEESETLLYGYVVITSEEIRGARTFWAPVKRILPNRSVSIMKKRVDYLMNIPSYLIFLERLRKSFPRIYLEGLEKGKYALDKDPNTLDLVPILEFFKSNTKE